MGGKVHAFRAVKSLNSINPQNYLSYHLLQLNYTKPIILNLANIKAFNEIYLAAISSLPNLLLISFVAHILLLPQMMFEFC